MMKYQGIYDHSPIFFQNFMATMYGYKAKKTDTVKRIGII